MSFFLRIWLDESGDLVRASSSGGVDGRFLCTTTKTIAAIKMTTATSTAADTPTIMGSKLGLEVAVSCSVVLESALPAVGTLVVRFPYRHKSP